MKMKDQNNLVKQVQLENKKLRCIITKKLSLIS